MMRLNERKPLHNCLVADILAGACELRHQKWGGCDVISKIHSCCFSLFIPHKNPAHFNRIYIILLDLREKIMCRIWRPNTKDNFGTVMVRNGRQLIQKWRVLLCGYQPFFAKIESIIFPVDFIHFELIHPRGFWPVCTFQINLPKRRTDTK